MTYSDNNPERRNLTILSLAIIIYYIGNGYLINPEISFTLINIGFKNKEALVITVWVILLWFLFRYILTNKHSHGEELRKSMIATNMDYAPVRTYLTNKGVNLNNADIRLKQTTISTSSNNSEWYIGFNNHHTLLKGFDGYLIIKLYLIKISLKHRASTDYYTPYILFFIAASIGVHNNLTDISVLIPVLAACITLLTIEVLYYIRN